MAAIACEQSIAASPERVFAVCTDFANAAKNVRGIDACEVLTEGPIGVGTRFRETRTMMGKKATETMEIVEFDAPRSYTTLAESCGCQYRARFDFLPEASGTRLRMTFEGTPLTTGAKIMSFIMRPLMTGMVRKCVMQDMADVKAACEANA